MIIEMAASAIISIGGAPTQGASETAWFVADEAEKGRCRLQDSYAFGMAGQRVLNEILLTVRKFFVSNWDGYGAEPVSVSTFRVAQQFLNVLTLWISAPT